MAKLFYGTTDVSSLKTGSADITAYVGTKQVYPKVLTFDKSKVSVSSDSYISFMAPNSNTTALIGGDLNYCNFDKVRFRVKVEEQQSANTVDNTLWNKAPNGQGDTRNCPVVICHAKNTSNDINVNVRFANWSTKMKTYATISSGKGKILTYETCMPDVVGNYEWQYGS